jgi:tetratricopeptide (TPR) repeat protein
MLGIGLLVALAVTQAPSVSPPPDAATAPAPAKSVEPARPPAAPPGAPAPAGAPAAATQVARPSVRGEDLGAELRRAKNEYAYGNYDRAADQLKALMYPMRLTDDEQVLEARKYLALSYYLLGKVAFASEEFGKLLYLAPDYELDPYTVPPPIIDTFDLVRKNMRLELDAIRQRKSDEQLAAPTQQGFRRTIEITISERSDFVTLLPFGVGQFQNGEVGWGVFFLTTELALLAANVTAYLWAASIGDYSTAEEDKRTTIERLTIVQYATAALFGVTWSFGVFQARLNFVPIVRAPPVVRDEPLKPTVVPTIGLSLTF